MLDITLEFWFKCWILGSRTGLLPSASSGNFSSTSSSLKFSSMLGRKLSNGIILLKISGNSNFCSSNKRGEENSFLLLISQMLTSMLPWIIKLLMPCLWLKRIRSKLSSSLMFSILMKSMVCWESYCIFSSSLSFACMSP
jgi:hypothetical protein